MANINKTALLNIEAILNKLSVGANQRVAELGCGNFGFFVWPLARLVGRGGLVYAVDILKPTLDEIKREATKDNLPQVKTVWSNLEIFKATAVENNSLDGALLVNTLHQSDKKIEILREAIRLLKRGGKLLIVDWTDIDSPLGPEPAKRVKVEALRAAAPKIGLELKEEFRAGPYHYGLILIKL